MLARRGEQWAGGSRVAEMDDKTCSRNKELIASMAQRINDDTNETYITHHQLKHSLFPVGVSDHGGTPESTASMLLLFIDVVRVLDSRNGTLLALDLLNLGLLLLEE